LSKLDKYDEILIEILCRRACRFYKPKQEEKEEDFRCGAYLIFKKMLKQGDINKENLEKTYKTITKKT
jgi:hypothetical protein